MVARVLPARDELFRILDTVMDPEVPVLSVVDLGIVRGVEVTDDEVIVIVTPTYSGCPAMRTIEEDIVRALQRNGVPSARVRTVYDPAWTTDWLSPDAKRRLEEYGIAAPPRVSVTGPGLQELVPIRPRAVIVVCPYCTSAHTTVRSEFGSTACKSIYFCNGCRQPFELFKPI